ncbi:hypothetical protein [Paenibacillus sp. IHBB 10380]|uniref:hypothetical protein n=1 Tax=Paenibacillus sp. IHBB 10380 TaxID=1566358 RepID=UPI0005CFD0BE|nr:hypothetical protein [Paenibacillus sp. IHBB 10380]AJS58734.1 hypothetical protein UB51_09820 [Paenibacillus sp. IHBB 10380]
MMVMNSIGGEGNRKTKVYVYNQAGKLLYQTLLDGFLETVQGGVIITVDGYSTGNDNFIVPIHGYNNSLKLLYKYQPPQNYTVTPAATSDGTVFISSTVRNMKAEKMFALNVDPTVKSSSEQVTILYFMIKRVNLKKWG